jgi:acetyltransferase
VKFAIVHTAGFKEVGVEGLQLERQIVEVAHKYGMRIYGPNSQGIQNSDPEVSVYANFTFVPMSPGNISIVAQSGGVGETLKLHLYRIGKGIRMYASFGNEADVSMNEIIDYYGQDEDTKVIMVHIETMKDPAGFLEVAKQVTPKKPILALKTGKTDEGKIAVASHTGAMIEQETIINAIFKKSGVLRFDTQEDMINAAVAFSNQPVPNRERVCLVTNTGGPAIIGVDECISAGLKLARLSAETKETLGKLVFQEAIVSNPVDVVATAGPEEYGGTVEALLKDTNIDSLLLVFVTAPFVDCEGIARKLGEIGKTAEKPIVCQVITIEKWEEVIRIIRESGIPVYDFAEDAARALSAMTQYGKFAQRRAPTYRTYEVNRPNTDQVLTRHRGTEKFLPPQEVFEILRYYGIPTVISEKVEKKGELDKLAVKIGYPVVLKVDSAEIVHKTEVGGVAVDLKDKPALLFAFDDMSRKFAEEKPSFLMQEYITGGIELIMGAKGNKDLQSTLMFGFGGILVEAIKDVQFRLAPLSEQDAFEMIRSIKGFSVLEGVRGQKPVDIAKLAEILIRLSQLISDFPEIDELDLNPVVALEEGKGAVVVDARMKLRKEAPERVVVPGPSEPAKPPEPPKPPEPTKPPEPAKPKEPGKPEEPKKPEKPPEPSKPEEPGEPGKPPEPAKPGEPAPPPEPVKPEKPEESVKPEEPSEPKETEKPGEPAEPEEPGQPPEPVKPEEPEELGEPGKPPEPIKPGEPGKPEEPPEPVKPEEPSKPEEKGKPSEPKESAEKEESEETIDPSKIIERIERIEELEGEKEDEEEEEKEGK